MLIPRLHTTEGDGTTSQPRSPQSLWQRSSELLSRFLTYRVAAGLLILLGAFLRLRQWLFARSYWGDELMVLRNIADRGYLQLAEPLDYSQTAPVGWLWLERLMGDLIGFGERSMRFVPLLYGIALLVVIAWLARQVLNAPAALLVLGFAAVNQYLIYYSNEVKQYTSEAFWVTLLLALGVLIIQRGPTWRRILTYWTVALIGVIMTILAIPVTIAVAGVLAVHALWIRRSSPDRWRALGRILVGAPIWGVIVGLLYVGVLRAAQNNPALQEYWSRVYPSQPLTHLRATWGWLRQLTRGLLHIPLDVSYPAVFLLLVFVGLLLCWRRWGLAIAALLVAPWAIGYTASALSMYPMAHRLALFGVPAVLLLLGSAVDQPASWLRESGARALTWLLPYGLAVALLVPQVYTAANLWRHPFDRFQHREQLEYIAAHGRDSDFVVGSGHAEFAAGWYGPLTGVEIDAIMKPSKLSSGTCDPEEFPALLRLHDTAWLILVEPNIETHDRFYRQYLESFGQQVEEIPFAGGLVIRYDLTAPPGGPLSAQPPSGYDCAILTDTP